MQNCVLGNGSRFNFISEVFHFWTENFITKCFVEGKHLTGSVFLAFSFFWLTVNVRCNPSFSFHWTRFYILEILEDTESCAAVVHIGRIYGCSRYHLLPFLYRNENIPTKQIEVVKPCQALNVGNIWCLWLCLSND